MRKLISSIAILLALICLFTACSSNNTVSDEPVTCVTEDPTASRTIYGSLDKDYAHSYFYEVTLADGTLKPVEIRTDDIYLVTSLQTLGIMSSFGSGEDFGYTLTETLPEGYKWQFFIDGTLYKDGPEDVEIVNGAVYSFVAVSK